MKAIWKGYLKCRLVTIPIRMFTATTKRPLQFHLYHKACGSRIHQEDVCPVCGQTLGPEDIVKGYQYGKDLHVVLTDDDFATASTNLRMVMGNPGGFLRQGYGRRVNFEFLQPFLNEAGVAL